jgi:hypothetical protein
MAEKETFASVDDLFNSSIDDLADLPSFEVPPAGSYILEVTCDVKEVAGKQAVEASLTVIETVELADPAAEPVKDGTVFSTLFFLDNKFGVGKLKQFLKPFGAHFNDTNIGNLVRDHVKQVTIAGTVLNRKAKKDSEDPDRIYGSVANISVM